MQRRALRAIQDSITVVAARCRKARMKIVADMMRPHHADVVGEIAVETELPATIVAFIASIKMHNLAARMHARIGAAGANDFNGFVGDLGQSLFEPLLYAEARLLALPAVVRSPVVLNAECDANVLSLVVQQVR